VAGIISSSLNTSSSFVTSLPTFTPRTSTHEALSTREANIFQMLGRNKTNAQIANDLDLNDSIVRQDTIHIYRKLGINSHAEARSFYKEHFENQKDLKTQ
jgi:DNA-binding NarL/FixJ family response regulator